MNNSIHIVSFDVPFPPNYGGVVDVFNRAKALKENGFRVVLHAFDYGRGKSHNFSEICDEIQYYGRKNFLFSFLKRKSYISESRISKELINRLNNSEGQILIEGQHCAGILPFLNRKALVRIHNIEWKYYAELAKRETSFMKKWYFKREAKCLKCEEFSLELAVLLCITKKETDYYKNLKFKAVTVPTVVFHHVNKTEVKDYVLFHGNLSVNENEEAVHVLLKEITKTPISLPLLVAGKNPSIQLKTILEKANVQLIESPSEKEMFQLLNEAKMHLLFSNQTTGIKLKLLNSLATNRPVIVNEKVIEGTDLADSCIIWNNENSLSKCVEVALSQKKLAVDLIKFSPENYVKIISDLSVE